MSKAEERLQKKKRNTKIVLASTLAILSIVLIGAIFLMIPKDDNHPEDIEQPIPKEQYVVQDGNLLVDTSSIDDNELHFYGYEHNGTNIVFFIVNGTDNKLHVAFNLCTYGPCIYECMGFTQAGTHVKCNSAGCTYPINCINTDEDSCCIPRDITFEETEDSVIINVDEIISAERYYLGDPE